MSTVWLQLLPCPDAVDWTAKATCASWYPGAPISSWELPDGGDAVQTVAEG